MIRSSPKVKDQIASLPFRIYFLVHPLSNPIGFEQSELKNNSPVKKRGNLILLRSGADYFMIRYLPVVTKQKFKSAQADLIFFFLHANSSEA